MRRLALMLVVLAAARAHAANQLIVDARTLRMNDMATVTVVLEGEFAEVEAVSPPLGNLAIVGEPWVSSEFIMVNTRVVRRRVFRFRIRPVAPGPATVGPMELRGDDGGRDVLPQVVLNVEPLRGLGSNDPQSLLRELVGSGRDPLFVIAEVGRTDVYVGEPLRISWYLYNAVDVQGWQIVDVPKLQDFFAEEIPVRNEPPERVFIGDVIVQRVPIRRVILYPLRSGTLQIGGMTLEATVMHRSRTSLFFEGEMVETSFYSAPITVSAKPIPPGPPVDVVGDLRLDCDAPRQRNAGPVVVNVSLGGEANLRSVAPPRFAERIAGEVQIEEGQVATSREEGSAAMTRRWRYLIFPEKGGLLYVPPLTLRTFVPATGARKELQCSAATIEAKASSAPVPETASAPAAQSRRRLVPWIAGGALLLVFAMLAWPRIRRERALSREVRSIVRGKTPAEIRAAIDARVKPSIATEASDRGEAYRSLRSLLDAAERERDIGTNAEAEIARRVRELLRIAK